MERNKQIFNSTQKANYHNDRVSLSSLSDSQRRYSIAFLTGDSLVRHGFSGSVCLRESGKFTTLFEKKAFWRGAKNAKSAQEARLRK